MEALHGLVGAVCDELEPRMPRRVYSGREYGVVLHVHLLYLAVVCHHGTSMVVSCVELHALRVSRLVVVAVYALSVHLCAEHHVAVDDTLFVVLQISLVDGQVLVCDIRGCYEPIADIAVDGIGRNVYSEGFVPCPCTAILCKHLYGDVLARRLGRKSLPVVYVRHGLPATAYNLLAFGRIACHHLFGILHELQGQWGDVHRHGNIDIVGVDFWQSLAVGILRGHLSLMA